MPRDWDWPLKGLCYYQGAAKEPDAKCRLHLPQYRPMVFTRDVHSYLDITCHFILDFALTESVYFIRQKVRWAGGASKAALEKTIQQKGNQITVLYVARHIELQTISWFGLSGVVLTTGILLLAWPHRTEKLMIYVLYLEILFWDESTGGKTAPLIIKVHLSVLVELNLPSAINE